MKASPSPAGLGSVRRKVAFMCGKVSRKCLDFAGTSGAVTGEGHSSSHSGLRNG